MFRIVSSAVVAAGLVLLAIAPASAAEVAPRSVGQCPSGSACFWSDAGNAGSFGKSASCSSGGSNLSLSAIGGEGRSAKNFRSSGSIYLRNNGSTVAVLGPGGSVSNTAFNGATCYL